MSALRRTAMLFRAPRTWTRPVNAVRTYATSPEDSSNVTGNPQSSGPESQGVNASRATDHRTNPDSASNAEPVSDPSASGLGAQEEQQGSHDAVRQDPNKPAHEKAAEVEKQGQKPLDPADK